ncbi:ribonuclease H-like domain-containing protein [Kalaharituber pfeilii]|nr:ribonuclease H-like domain-containing protein [Kalaharituber pfeilii]
MADSPSPEPAISTGAPLLPAFLPPSVTPSKLLSGQTYTYVSSIPQSILDNPTAPVMLGVDEAGRGPVLGPMVYAAAYCLESYEDRIKKLGFADSKKMTPTSRLALLTALSQSPSNDPSSDLPTSLGWLTTLLSPATISTGMLPSPQAAPYNLNTLAHDTTISLITTLLSHNVNVTAIYIDTVGPPGSYQAKLQKLFPRCKVRVEKKADSLFPIVSAASVCAKVTRDLALEVLAGKIKPPPKEGQGSRPTEVEEAATGQGIDLGSGYPGDAKTISYLKDSLDPIFGWDDNLVRFSWATAKDMLEKERCCVKVEWAEPLEEGEQSIMGFLSGDTDAGGVGGWFGKSVGVADF